MDEPTLPDEEPVALEPRYDYRINWNAPTISATPIAQVPADVPFVAVDAM